MSLLQNKQMEQTALVPSIFLILLTGFAGVSGLLLLFYSLRMVYRLLTGSDQLSFKRPAGVVEFIVCASGLSFIGWIVFMAGSLNEPGALAGLPLFYTALCGIVIPLSGILFFSRQWVIGWNFHIDSAGELFARYYDNKAVGLLVVFIGLCYFLPVAGALFHFGNELILNLMNGGGFPDAGLMGWSIPFTELYIDGVVGHLGSGDEHWSAALIFTFMLGLLGVQSSPCFTMMALAAKKPTGFAPQLVWASAFLIGGLIVLLCYLAFTSAVLSIHGAHDSVLVLAMTAIGLGILISSGLVLLVVNTLMISRVLFAYNNRRNGDVAEEDNLASDYCLIHSRHCFVTTQMAIASALFIAAAWLSAYAPFWNILTFGFFSALSFQLFPALMGLCYVPWFTGQGILLGMIAGVVGVLLTDVPNEWLSELLGFPLLFGRFPLSLHSSFWGMVFNLITVVVVSALTQRRNELAHRALFHQLYRAERTVLGGKPAPLGTAPFKRSSVTLAFMMIMLWFFFAVGPGSLLGNDLFGTPHLPASWTFGVPSLLVWQFIFWGAGVCMIWFLAYRINRGRLVT